MVKLTIQQVEDCRRDGYILVGALYDKRNMRGIAFLADEVSNVPEIPGKYIRQADKDYLFRV